MDIRRLSRKPRPFNVLVFPCSNNPALEIVTALACSNKVRLFAASSVDPRIDLGPYLVKRWIQLPWIFEEEFEPSLCELVKRYSIDLIFPTTDECVRHLAQMEKLQNVRIVAPRKELAILSESKLSTYTALAQSGLVPKIYSEADQVPFPAYAKPDKGGGGRGHFIIHTEEDLRRARQAGYLVTEYLPGDEYTVDCLSDLGGNLLFANVRLRAVTGGGVSLASYPVQNEQVLNGVQIIADNLRPEGPWFAQFKLDYQQKPKLLEVNCRVAGCMTVSRLQGMNIPLAAVFLYMGWPIKIPPLLESIHVRRVLEYRVRLARQIKIVVWDLDDTILDMGGVPRPRAVAVLVSLYNRRIPQVLLTRNEDAQSILEACKVPNVFDKILVTDDKAACFRDILEQYHVLPEQCAIVNDSYTERFDLTSRCPKLLWVTPDCVDILADQTV